MMIVVLRTIDVDAEPLDRKGRARLARERFYALHQQASPKVQSTESPRRRPERPAPPANTVEKQGVPCPGRNESWLTAITNKVFSLAEVLTSADVPDEAYEMRMEVCRACAYSTKARGHYWCGCCGCPQWNLGGISSSVEYKNRKAAWRCPRPDPAFGPWGGVGFRPPHSPPLASAGFDPRSKRVRNRFDNL
ncbi:MAG: hypothetical protein WBE26_08455 [Phycisphaerae bacterium]